MLMCQFLQAPHGMVVRQEGAMYKETHSHRQMQEFDDSTLRLVNLTENMHNAHSSPPCIFGE